MRRNKKRNRVLRLFFLVMLIATNSMAQTPISLQGAIDTALANNLNLQAVKLKIMAAQKMEGTAMDVPFASVNAEYGKINSAYTDTRLGLSQSFSFPVVYKRQRQLLQAQTTSLKLSQEDVKRQLKKEVTILYYQLLLMEEKKQLLLQAVSLFQAFLKKQEQRFAAGDINVLEKTAAETQRMQIVAQLQLLNADLAGLRAKFSSLLNTGIDYIPMKDKAKASLNGLPDASVISTLPFMKTKKQQQQIALREMAVQRAKLVPQFSLGYTNQSIKGLQNVNGAEKFYTAANRFSSVMVGLNFPLFHKAFQSRIAASKYNYDAVQVEYNEMVRQQKTIYNQLLLQYKKNEQQLSYYEQHALKQAQLLREHSNLQLNSGAISYIEWLLLIQQSIQLEADYFTALNDWNLTVIELNAYTNN